MKRIVYAPKVDAYVKTDTGIINLTPHLVRGSVTRKIDQVSSAMLEFRNPNEVFTPENRPALIHPMDPIVIFMRRFKDKPVQVFTGYVDSAPYFSIKAGGDLTLEASCTLKRLLYTYYDPGLKFFHKFIQAQGWTVNGSGILPPDAQNPQTIQDARRDNDNDKFPEPIADELNDASFGQMLYQTMLYIGNWDPKSIYIENLPNGIVDLVEGIFFQVETSSKDDRERLREQLKYILENNTFEGMAGTDSSNDMSTYGGEGPPPFAKVSPVDVGRAMLNAGFPSNAETIAAGIYVVDVESKFGTYSGWDQLNSAGCVGYWQFQIQASWGGHDISLKDSCTLVPATMFAKTLWTGGTGTSGFSKHWYDWWGGSAVGTQNASQYIQEAKRAIALGKFST